MPSQRYWIALGAMGSYGRFLIQPVLGHAQPLSLLLQGLTFLDLFSIFRKKISTSVNLDHFLLTTLQLPRPIPPSTEITSQQTARARTRCLGSRPSSTTSLFWASVSSSVKREDDRTSSPAHYRAVRDSDETTRRCSRKRHRKSQRRHHHQHWGS